MLIIHNTLTAYSFIVCIDLWSRALSIPYYKMLMFCIEKKSVTIFCEMKKLLSVTEEVSHNANGRAEGIIGANSENKITELCL